MFRSMFPRSSSARRARFILSAGANRDARSSDRVHCRTLNTGHTLSQIQLLDAAVPNSINEGRAVFVFVEPPLALRARWTNRFPKKDCSFLTVTD